MRAGRLKFIDNGESALAPSVTIAATTHRFTSSIYFPLFALKVFWWLVEGKFGSRQEALAPRLLELVHDAALRCDVGTDDSTPCSDADWEMITPGWSLGFGIAAVSEKRRQSLCGR